MYLSLFRVSLSNLGDKVVASSFSKPVLAGNFRMEPEDSKSVLGKGPDGAALGIGDGGPDDLEDPDTITMIVTSTKHNNTRRRATPTMVLRRR